MTAHVVNALIKCPLLLIRNNLVNIQYCKNLTVRYRNRGE